MTMRGLVAKYLGRHTPGRVTNAERRTVLREASLDELLAIGTCECGQSLETHRPVADPPRITSWMTLRSLDQSLSGVARQNASQGWSIKSEAHYENTRP
jgi:hypothetical protein